MQSTLAVQGEESDDGIDWGAAPAEGDAEMDNSKSFVNPIPYGETAAATSARTGDKDQRCEWPLWDWLTPSYTAETESTAGGHLRRV